MTSLKAAILAVGTEVVDGQIFDRNSAWISSRLVHAGIQVGEHRVVADDREAIARALLDLQPRCDFIFLTGGLGPTSDDFTREVLADVFKLPLEFDENSWQRIMTRFRDRGAIATEIQKQQCYFPRGADILVNSAGTANAFAFRVRTSVRESEVYALPGPPAEVETVWKDHLASRIENRIPESDRDELHLFRTLGAGESVIAEIIEPLIKGTGLRVGYRAHVPYVEVKIWCLRANRENAQPVLQAVSAVLQPFLVNLDDADTADDLLDVAIKGESLRIVDSISHGYLEARMLERLRERGFQQQAYDLKGRLIFETHVGALNGNQYQQVNQVTATETDTVLRLWLDEPAQCWRAQLKSQIHPSLELEVLPTSLYNINLERGRRYAVEKILQMVGNKIKAQIGE